MFSKLVLCSVIATTCACATANAISYPNSGNAADITLAQLPHNVIPRDYVVAITPNVDTMRMAGTETVTLYFTEASNKIQFNSAKQKLAHVRLDGATVQSVQSNEGNQLTTVTLKTPAAIGQHVLSFSFVGQIGDTLQGIFTQPHATHNGVKDLYLTAQFEGTATHRIFPCWENAMLNATYQLNVTVPNSWNAWSSMPVTARDVAGEFTTISYEKTSDIGSLLFEFSNVRQLQVPENYIGKN